MQGNLEKPRKHASTPAYVSPNHLILPGFETHFDQKLTKNNLWVRLVHSIPWDRLVKYYDDLLQEPSMTTGGNAPHRYSPHSQYTSASRSSHSLKKRKCENRFRIYRVWKQGAKVFSICFKFPVFIRI